MLEKNILGVLPEEISLDISSYLDFEAVKASTLVSKEWSRLFAGPTCWKYRLHCDFNIELDVLSKIYRAVAQHDPFIYKKLYKRLYTLSKYRRLVGLEKAIFQDRSGENLLLLSRLTDSSYNFFNLPCYEQNMLAILAIYTKDSAITIQYAEKNKENENLLEELFCNSFNAGNLNLVKYFLDNHKKFVSCVNQMLDRSILSGNLSLVQFLLDPVNMFGFEVDAQLLSLAAQSGNLSLFQFLYKKGGFKGLPLPKLILSKAVESRNFEIIDHLLHPKNGFNLSIEQIAMYNCSFTIHMFKYAVNADEKNWLKSKVHEYQEKLGEDLDVLKYVLEHQDEFELKPNKKILDGAIKAGNLEVVMYLLDPQNNFNLYLNDLNLLCAVASGNLQLVKYLLNPENKFGLIPDHNYIKVAARSGNLSLVKFLLNPENKFDLRPTQRVLQESLQSGNVKLVRYLLNPKNKFELKVGDTELDNVPCYYYELKYHLLVSHKAFQEAIEEIQHGNLTNARNLFTKSAIACQSHYCFMWDCLLSNPKDFNLEQSAIECLKIREELQKETDCKRQRIRYH